MMMKRAIGTPGNKGKERRAGLWMVSVIVSFQMGLALFSVATAGPLKATTFVVNSTLDETDTTPGDGVCLGASGFCTLRAAIQEANTIAGPNTIKLQTGLYMLTIPGRSENACATGDLDITDDLTITGKDAKNTFINGGKLDRVFHMRGSISVKITNMTIQNGLATDDGYGDLNNPKGGGILNESDSTLKLSGVTISNNTAAEGINTSGGGIYNLGTLEITKITMFNNAAIRGSFAVQGGAILNGGTLTITGSTISNNTVSGGKDSWGYGGAILNFGVGILTITKSTISNNTIAVDHMAQGGGIANNGTVTITQSTISNNTAIGSSGQGGGVITSGSGQQQVTITGSTISNNVARGYWAEGGGICGFGDGNEIIIAGSTLSYNAASGGIYLGESLEGLGGGIYVDGGTLTVENASKIVSNFSSDEGGGVINDGSATASISADSTVSKNIPDDIINF